MSNVSWLNAEIFSSFLYLHNVTIFDTSVLSCETITLRYLKRVLVSPGLNNTDIFRLKDLFVTLTINVNLAAVLH